jgi:hypothetical protein
MDSNPIALDKHRGLVEQRATEIRRRLADVAADHAEYRQRRGDLETFLAVTPATTWREAAEKARYLISVLAQTPSGREPRRQRIIDSVLADFKRLGEEPDEPVGGEAQASRQD